MSLAGVVFVIETIALLQSQNGRQGEREAQTMSARDISASVTLSDIHFSSTLGNLGSQNGADSFLEEATILLIIH